MARLFLSYATQDFELATSVFAWLSEDGHEVFFDRDVRDGMHVGEDWKLRLYDELSRVDAVVCVLSAAYLKSTWCTAEVAVADSRGCLLIPLLVEEGVSHRLIERQQYTSTDPVLARAQVLARVRQLDIRGMAEWRDGTNPYPGLASFTAARSRLFFGRSEEIRKLAARVRSDTGRGVLAISGSSGCGKSSLLRAGLLPAMESDPEWLVVDPWSPERDPGYAMAKALTATGLRHGLSWSLPKVRDRLRAERGLLELADELLIAGRAGRILVPIDQAEELFAPAADPDRRTALADQLALAISGGTVRVVVTVRSEYLDDLVTLPGLTADSIENQLLGPLAKDMLRAAIEEPARIAGLRLEPGLSAQLIADTETSDALPLLAFALHQLAEGRSRGDDLTLAAYHDLGARHGYRDLTGLHAVLAAHADEALREAHRASELSPKRILTGLVRLVSRDAGGRLVRRSVDLAALPDQMRNAVGVFVDRRLLTTDDQGALVRFTHEALLTAWRPLAEAIAEHGKALHTAQSVEQAAQDWITSGRAEGYLWDEERYTATMVDLGPSTQEGLIDATGHEFLVATRARRDRARRKNRLRRRRTISALAAFSVVALIAALIAVVQAQIAQSERDAATVRELVARADSVRVTDPQLALRLALAAHSFLPSTETKASLLRTLTMNNYASIINGHTSSIFTVAFSPDGRTLAAGDGDDHTLRLWDVSDPLRPKAASEAITDHTAWVQAAEFTPDGRTLVTASHDEVILWQADDARHPRKLATIPPPLQSKGSTDNVGIALSPDGQVLASSHGGAVTLWNVTDPAQPSQIGGVLHEHDGSYSDVTFSSDGRFLATADGRGGTVRLWDVGLPSAPRLMSTISKAGATPRDTLTVTAITFLPGRSILAVAIGDISSSGPGALELWNISSPARPARLGTPLTEHTAGVRDVAFSPDGRTMATTSYDQSVIVWDVSNPSSPRRQGDPLTDHTNDVHVAAFAKDGTLATGSADNKIILWTKRNPVQPVSWRLPQLTHDGPVAALAFSPDGRVLVSSPEAGLGRVWDISTPDQPRGPGLLFDRRAAISSLAFRPDGAVLAAGSGGKGTNFEVTLWNVTDPVTPRREGVPLLGHDDPVVGLSFSADGETLWSVNRNVSLIRWNVTVPAQARQTAHALPEHSDYQDIVAFRSDQRAIASTGPEGVIVRDISDPDNVVLLDMTLRDHYARTMLFSPDGKTLFTGGDDVLVWDMSSAWQPRRYGTALGTGNGVRSLAISTDGETLAVGSEKEVTLWNVEDPAHPFRLGPPLTVEKGPIDVVALNRDGHLLATGSNSGEVLLWDLSRVRHVRDHLTDEACARARRGLNEDEWIRQVGANLAFRKSCG